MFCDIKENVLIRFHLEKKDGKIAEIPSGIRGIGKEAFASCMSVRRVVLPEGVEFIGERAFAKCYMLSEISLPESLRVIGAEAFADCWNLKQLNLPRHMEAIGRGAFKGCSDVEEICLPDGLTILEPELFAMCEKLRRVSLPASIREVVGCKGIGEGVFFGTVVTELRLRGGWYKDFARTLGISVFMLLQELYVQDVSCVPEQFLPTALSTFARHMEEFSEAVRAHYYEYMRANARAMYGVCSLDLYEEVLEMICREDLILPQDAQGYFMALLSYPERMVKLTEHLCRKQLLDGESLRICLNIAIDRRMTEVTAMLLEYRQNCIGEEMEDDLTL